MKKVLVSAMVLATLSFAGVASADEAQQAPRAQRGVVNLDTLIITSHLQRPVASIEVNRMEPALTLSDLRVALVERIETAIYGSRF
jgi:hypothetical protein